MGGLRSILVALLFVVLMTACAPMPKPGMVPPSDKSAGSVEGGGATGGETGIGGATAGGGQVATGTGEGGGEATVPEPPVAPDAAKPGTTPPPGDNEGTPGGDRDTWVITGIPHGYTDNPYWFPGSAGGERTVGEPPEGQGKVPIQPGTEPRPTDGETEHTPNLTGEGGTEVGEPGSATGNGGGTLGATEGPTVADGEGIGSTIGGVIGKLVPGSGGSTPEPEHPSVTPSPSPPPNATDGARDEAGTEETPESQSAKIDAYLDRLPSAAYTFNPPSPIKVAKPHTVYLWLDPSTTPEELAGELRETVPEDAARIESGETEWSPIMEATLTGSAFEIEAVRPERQSVSSTQRTTWAWDVTATEVGKHLPLHLTLNVILPADLGPPHTIKTLDRRIDVEVTLWWAFDHYFDRYWKWLLGGLGTTLAGVIAWWWKRRTAAVTARAGG